MTRRSNVSRARDTYHHADLRRALLDAAIAHLDDGDVTSLTMQHLARAAGVSAAAPYHHFPDKVSVVAALAKEGFEVWLGLATEALASVTTPREQLVVFARCWLRFAAAHPSHYRVMFLKDIEDRERFAALHETSIKGLWMLVGIVGRVWPDLSPAEAKTKAVAVWSTLHGFASLRDAGVLSNIPKLLSLASLEAATIALVLGA